MAGENKSGLPPEMMGMLSGLLSNPQALAILSSMLGQMSFEKPDKKPDTDTIPCREPPSCPPPKHEKHHDRRRNLLLALKPYLSPERCQAVERILMIQEAIELFQNGKRDH